jgi:predicted ABC-type ATPase
MADVDAPKRLRMFAGPNGSGKTTLVHRLAKEFSPRGVFQLHQFVNADEILLDLHSGRGVDFKQYGLAVTRHDVMRALRQSARLGRFTAILKSLSIRQSRLMTARGGSRIDVAAAIADFLREELLEAGRSFAFETVMSHPNKVEFFARARAADYRTYLYFVATRSPEFNIHRVENRVAVGGHTVPRHKIVERYHRSLALVGQTLEHAYRAYFFDNSGPEPRWLAELTPDKQLQLKVPPGAVPKWFRTWVASPFRYGGSTP